MSFDFTVNFKSELAFNNNNVNSRLLWSKATEYDISNYVNILNDNLNYISISEDLFHVIIVIQLNIEMQLTTCVTL